MNSDDPILKNIEVPGGGTPTVAPAAPTTTIAAPAPAPAPSFAHPTDPILKDIQVPSGIGEQPSLGSTASPPPPSSWSDYLLGPQTELQPRPLSQVGGDIENFGRRVGNKAFIPGSLDVGLAALHGTPVAAENAKTTRAGEDLGPVAAGIADFMGQRMSVNRMLGAGNVPYANSPLAQGVVTGGFGTLLHGGSWRDALTNAAADTGLSTAAEAIGTGASALAKGMFDKSRQAVSSARTAGLEDLQDLWKRGGDVASQAEAYAKTARGEAKTAYENIAAAANRATDTSALQRATAAGIGTYVPWVGPLAAAYVADPAFKTYNALSKGVDVRHAIDSAYPAVANVAKTIVDPDKWRSALQSLAVSQGPTNPGSANAAARSGPVSWVKSLMP